MNSTYIFYINILQINFIFYAGSLFQRFCFTIEAMCGYFKKLFRATVLYLVVGGSVAVLIYYTNYTEQHFLCAALKNNDSVLKPKYIAS